MDTLTAKEVVLLPEGTAMHLCISDFDTIPLDEALEAIQVGFRALKNNGILEFKVLDFGWIAQNYTLSGGGLSREISMKIFSAPRRAAWDEPFAARVLLETGFYKVWTGHLGDLPEEMMMVKAIKFQLPNKS